MAGNQQIVLDEPDFGESSMISGSMAFQVLIPLAWTVPISHIWVCSGRFVRLADKTELVILLE